SLRSFALSALWKSSTRTASRPKPSTSVSRYSLAMGDAHTRRHQARVSRCHLRPSGFGRVGARRRSPSGGGVSVAAPAFLFRRWRRCAGFGAGPRPAMAKTPRPVHGKILLPVRLSAATPEVFDPPYPLGVWRARRRPAAESAASLRRRQLLQSACRLLRWSVPPWDLGLIWSTVVDGFPQIRQKGSSLSTCARIFSQSPLYPSNPRRPGQGYRL